MDYPLLFITSAPMTPGTHPHSVSRKTMSTDPQPLSITARGGQKMQTITLSIPIIIFDVRISIIKIENYSTTAYYLFPEQMIRRLQYLQPQVSGVVWPLIQEFLNGLAGFGRMMAGEGSCYPASREEDVSGAPYLFQKLQ